jgi:hypothetical protein
MSKLEHMVKPSFILRVMINKDLLSQGDIIEICCARGMLSAFSIQGQITTSTFVRFNNLLFKAQKYQLKLNTKKDKK